MTVQNHASYRTARPSPGRFSDFGHQTRFPWSGALSEPSWCASHLSAP